MVSMERKVDIGLIKNWIDEKSPGGMSKLASKSEISERTLSKVRNGYVPPRRSTRIEICKAIGVSEDVLFPVTAGVAS